MDGHRPVFTLIDYDRKKENLVFDVSFDDDQLIMQSQSDPKLEYIYDRIFEMMERCAAPGNVA